MLETEQPANDLEVITRVRAGDLDAFEIIMRRHNPRVYRAVRSILRDEDEVEDVMQEAYVKAFQHLSDFEGRSAFSTWLIRIAVHEALARKRRAQRFDVLAEDEEALWMNPSNDPEKQTSSAEMIELLEQAIDGLKDGFREVFMLRAVEELSQSEVAECLGIKEETVKTRYFRAKEALRGALIQRLESGLEQTFPFRATRCDRVVARVRERVGRQ